MDLQAKLVKYRRELHQYPELSMQEIETTKRLKKWLSDNGIEILDLKLPVGVVAQIKGGSPGPVIALRSDIDALPIKEQSGVEFYSRNDGVMHACGHDIHMATMLGAAILLNSIKDTLAGTIKILFQPAEESSNGAVWFGEQPGVLDGVEAIFGFHNKPDLPAGTIGVRSGALMASVDRFEIEISGVGGHGGMPELCKDPIVSGAQLINTVQSIVSRKISSLDNVVVSITKFVSGNTWNVIPEKAFLEGTVRTFQDEARSQIPKIFQDICSGIAIANQVKVDFNWYPSIGVVKNTPTFANLAWEVAEKGRFSVVQAERSLAGEDFAYYLEKIPGCFLWIGVNGSQPWHHPAYTASEEGLTQGAKYFFILIQEVFLRWEDLITQINYEAKDKMR